MTYLIKGKKGYYQAISALFLGSFVSFMILYSVQTLLPNFSADYQVSPAVASLALSISTGCLAVSMLLVAPLADAVGKKRLMTTSLFLTSILCVLVAFSPNFSTLLGIRAVQGIVLAGFPSIAMAYVIDEFDPKTLGTVMGLHVSGNTIGGLTGRFLTGVLTEWVSWQFALLTMGIISLVISFFFLKLLPESRQPAKETPSFRTFAFSIVQPLKEGRLLCLFAFSFVLMGSFVTVYNYLGFRLLEPPFSLNQTWIGLIFFVYLVGTFSSTFMGQVSDMAGKAKTLSVSILIMLIGAGLTLSHQLLFVILALCIFTFGFFGGHSIASRWVGEVAARYRAQAASLYLFCYYLGSSVIGSSNGFIWEHFKWEGIITVVCTLIGLALVLIAIFLTLQNRQSSQQSAALMKKGS